MTRLADYIHYWETVTPDTIDTIDGVITDDMVFIDPFSHVTGIPAFKKVIRKMFADSDEPRFIVTDVAMTPDQTKAFLRWDFTFKMKGKPQVFSMRGVSEVHIAQDGRISYHLDHWDTASQLLRHFPIIGGLINFVFKKLAVH